jgi:predicted ATPase
MLLEEAAPDQHGVLIIATARPEWNPPPALLKYVNYLPIKLMPLAGPACRVLALSLLKRVAAVPDSAIDTIVQRSEGVPYYVEEIINWFLDRGIIDMSDEPWQFVADRFHEAPLPTTLQHLLLTRLSMLAENERVTLQRGSIFGRSLWEGGLAALGVPDCAPVLKRLQPRGFVDAQPESSLAGEKEWSFHHNLLREATYESLLKRERRSLHKAAAVWIETQARQAGRLNEFVGVLADHVDRAGDKSAAADWYLLAGAHARAQGAYQEARAYFERVLELLPPSDHERRWQAWLGRNDVVAHMGEAKIHRQCIEALLELSQYLGPAHVAEARYRRALQLDSVGDYPAALEEYRIALANARQGGATSLEVRMAGMLAICLGRLGEAETAAATAQQAVARLGEISASESVGLLTNLAIFYAESGDLALAAQMHQEQAAIGQKLGARSALANALLNLGYEYLCLGMYEAGHDALEQSLRLLESFGARRESAYARLNLGLIHWRMGDALTAHHLIKSVQHELAALGDTFAQAAGLSYWAIVLEQLHEEREAREHYETARGIFTQAGTRGYAADALAGLTRCAFALHDRTAAHRYVSELWNYLRLHGTAGMEFPLRAYVTCVEAFTALGENDKTRKAVELGYHDLIARAEKISRVEWGRSFLFNVPEHRTIIELWEEIAG